MIKLVPTNGLLDVVMERKVREWTLHDEIGRGGMGVVYRATHEMLPGDWAVKVIHPELGRDAETRARFLSEVTILKRLRHPNIIEVEAPFVESGEIYLPMELLKGQSLEKELKAAPGPWDPARAVALIAQAAAGIGYGHRQDPPVLHRDIKPGNIFVLSDGRVKVLDFGLARTLGDKSMTATGKAVGTPAYMAPEVLDGKKATPQSDVYGLGVVLYRLLAGRLPYDMPEEDSSVHAVFMAVARGIERGLPDVLEFVPGVPAALADLTMRALSCDPALRPADGAEFAALLGARDLSGRQALVAFPASQSDSDRTEIGIDLMAGRRRMSGPDGRIPASDGRAFAQDIGSGGSADYPTYGGGEESKGSSRLRVGWKNGRIVAVVSSALVLIAAACLAAWWFGFEVPGRAADRAAFERAGREATVSGWREYLRFHPSGAFRNEAYVQIADLNWCETAPGNADAAEWRSYLAAHPTSKCREQAEFAVKDHDACAFARRQRTAEGWREYLKFAPIPSGMAQSCGEEARGFINAAEAGIEWVRIEGGTFQMGSNDSDADDNEKPVHSVTLSTFEMAATETTVAQYKKCVDAGVCSAPDSFEECNWGKSGFHNYPVDCVDWNQASAYAKWVGGRLPTEAEWEYAARSGGRDQKYPWGNQNPTCVYAVMDDGTGEGCGRGDPWPVCSKTEGNTVQGLCDMSGNVWEWVSDWYGLYGAESVTNPKGPSSGPGRVLRGGSQYYNYFFLRVSFRLYDPPSTDLFEYGFRCARSQ